ncbi:MAG: Polyisoprenoid-binding protein [Phenylobacterium sp.]|nr:Polyisoprenoid-binding protein [Phenylobacterium sp.]
MTPKYAFAAGALALALSVGGAAALAQASHDPATVKPGVYKVEPGHTRVLFSVSHLGFTTWYGDFTGASGQLSLDPAHPAASRLEVSVPTASVVTTNAKLDGELKSADWFDAARFPTMTFKSRTVTPTGPGRADVAGDLTLHGVTRPVTLHARFNGAGVNPLDKAYTVGFEVSGEIRRSDFGVSKYVPMVGDQVQLIISAGFEKPGA